MENFSGKNDLPETLSKLFDGELSEDQYRDLEEKLSRDPELRRKYRQHLRLEALLHWQLVPEADLPDIGMLLPDGVLRQAVESATGDKQNEPPGPTSPALGLLQADTPVQSQTKWSYFSGPFAVGVLLALVVIPVVLLTFWYFPTHDADRLADVPSEKNTAEGQAQTVAILVRSVDCRWRDDRAVQDKTHLRAGDVLALDDGWVKVRFRGGAIVILEGPSEFHIESKTLGYLASGQLAAKLSDGLDLDVAKSDVFTVRTPQAMIVDRGTEFGVWVAEQGVTDVHVYQGAVDLIGSSRSQDASVGQGEQRLTVGTTAHVDNDGLVRLEARRDPSLLARKLPKPTTDRLPETLVPVTDELVMWLEAGSRVRKDAQGRVIRWGDIRLGGNKQRDDALQHEPNNRPQWVADAIVGRPAIRFAGGTHFLTKPFETTNDQTVFLVLSPGDIKANGGRMGSILNYNGPPKHVLGYAFAEPGVLQIGDLRKPGSLVAFVFAGRDGSGMAISDGRVASQQKLVPGEPCIGAYVYCNSENRAELFVNGESHAESTAKPFIANNSSKIIGKHPLDPKRKYYGDLAELLIYNRALSPSEVDEVNQYLAEKYGVADP